MTDRGGALLGAAWQGVARLGSARHGFHHNRFRRMRRR